MNDWINALFELVGSVLCWFNVWRLYQDKRLEGVVWQVQAFFTAWGLWNLYYYPSMGQWASFWGGVMLVLGNGAWVGLAVFYVRKREVEKRRHGEEGSAPGLPTTGTKASAAPCEEYRDQRSQPQLQEVVPRQVCLFVGGPLDGEKLSMEAYHVREGHVIEITLPGKESDYCMKTWGVFEFVSVEERA